ncbi:MAG: hypothetical protein PQJ59_01840 [Spirochaetales bacterium]|nr:hypothetical protein [Spirochaetales bacterium]
MGLEKVTESTNATKGSAPGPAVILTTSAAGDQERTRELYHPPGVRSAPTPEDRAVIVPVEGGVKVAVATHNYRIALEVSAGETVIYSTKADGSEVKAKIKLDAEGNVAINDGGKAAARQTDEIQSTSAEDPTFWTWITAVTSALSSLGYVTTPPSSLTGKITGGSETVEVGD